MTFLPASWGFLPSGLSFLHLLAHQPLLSLCAVTRETPRANERSSPQTLAEHMLCAGLCEGRAFGAEQEPSGREGSTWKQKMTKRCHACFRKAMKGCKRNRAWGGHEEEVKWERVFKG